MVGSQLRHVGPIKQDLLDLVDQFRTKYEQSYREGYLGGSERKVREAVDAWERKMSHKIRMKFGGATKKDEQMMRGFQKLGWLEYEPLAKQEVELILARSKGVSFLVFCRVFNSIYSKY